MFIKKRFLNSFLFLKNKNLFIVTNCKHISPIFFLVMLKKNFKKAILNSLNFLRNKKASLCGFQFPSYSRRYRITPGIFLLAHIKYLFFSNITFLLMDREIIIFLCKKITTRLIPPRQLHFELIGNMCLKVI